MILAKIFTCEGKIIPLVDHLIEMEIENTLNPETLFRANTICTKTIDALMQLCASNYLSNTLQTALESICSKKICFEIDPLKSDKKINIKKNTRQLTSSCQTVLDNIFASVDDCPR